MSNYYYFACNRCLYPLRTIVDNPSGHVECSDCGNKSFHEITKKEYDQLHLIRRAKP